MKTDPLANAITAQDVTADTAVNAIQDINVSLLGAEPAAAATDGDIEAALLRIGAAAVERLAFALRLSAFSYACLCLGVSGAVVGSLLAPSTASSLLESAGAALIGLGLASAVAGRWSCLLLADEPSARQLAYALPLTFLGACCFLSAETLSSVAGAPEGARDVLLLAAALLLPPAEALFCLVLERQARGWKCDLLSLLAVSLRRAALTGWLLVLVSVATLPKTSDAWLLAVCVYLGGFAAVAFLLRRIAVWLVGSIFWDDAEETFPPGVGWALVFVCLCLLRVLAPAAWETLQALALTLGAPLWLAGAAVLCHGLRSAIRDRGRGDQS